MDFLFDGLISQVGECRPFTNKLGHQSQERILVVSTDEQYPNTLPISLIGDIATQSYLPNQRVRCHLNFRASQNAQTGRWFANVSAWKVEII